MSVADPALAARYVEAHGGKVVVAPTTFEGRGTHALFRDDDGAVFGVLKSDTGDPPDGPVVAGEFLWLDLFTRDPKKAAEFYRGLAGYDVSCQGDAAAAARASCSRPAASRAAVVLPHAEGGRDARMASVRPGGRRRGGSGQGVGERRQGRCSRPGPTTSAAMSPSSPTLRGRARPREPDRSLEERTRQMKPHRQSRTVSTHGDLRRIPRSPSRSPPAAQPIATTTAAATTSAFARCTARTTVRTTAAGTGAPIRRGRYHRYRPRLLIRPESMRRRMRLVRHDAVLSNLCARRFACRRKCFRS